MKRGPWLKHQRQSRTRQHAQLLSMLISENPSKAGKAWQVWNMKLLLLLILMSVLVESHQKAEPELCPRIMARADEPSGSMARLALSN